MKNFTIALFGFLSLTAFGRGNYNILPTATMWPTPNGILFPNIATAGGVNSAALPLAGKATVVQGAYTKVTDGASEFFGGVGMTSRKFGVSYQHLGAGLHVADPWDPQAIDAIEAWRHEQLACLPRKQQIARRDATLQALDRLLRGR